MSELLNAAEAVLGPTLAGGRHDDPALLTAGGAISFGTLAREASRAGNALQALGVARRDRVLLLMRDTPGFVAAYLGALKIGAVAVALNTRATAAALAFYIADSGARLLVADAAFLPLLGTSAGEIAVAVAGGATEGLASWEAACAAAPDTLAPAPTRADEPAFWIYSSGTTGDPKAIVHAHKDVLPAGRVLTEVLGLGRGARVLSTSKLFFAYALDNAFLGPLRVGASIILHPDWPDPAATLALIERHRPDAVFSVPSFYRRLLAEPPERLRVLGGVAHYLSGGEAVPEALDDRWRAAVGRPILDVYGTSETFCVAIATRPGEARLGSVGRPMPGVRTRLLDETGAEVEPGAPGVLWIDHPALASGYWHRPDLTAQSFREGWFNTRDRFRVDGDGLWRHLGRADDMLKIAGQWVSPGAIEAVLAQVPGVAEVACVPVPDADGFPRLAAFVVPASAASALEGAVTDACAHELPRHQRPRWLRIVAELPRTATGKVQRFKLREGLMAEISGRQG